MMGNCPTAKVSWRGLAQPHIADASTWPMHGSTTNSTLWGYDVQAYREWNRTARSLKMIALAVSVLNSTALFLGLMVALCAVTPSLFVANMEMSRGCSSSCSGVLVVSIMV